MTTPSYTPVAYQDDLSGRKIVGKVPDSDDYVLLLPSEAGPQEVLRGSWILESALAREGFTLFKKWTSR